MGDFDSDEALKDYLSTHRVPEMVEELLSGLYRERPPSPTSYLLQKLRERRPDALEKAHTAPADMLGASASYRVGDRSPRRSKLLADAGASTTGKRTAVYGGAFDPITNGHLSCAAQIIQSGAADEVLLVPCGPRPDKPKLKTPALDRYIMCQIAVNTAFPPGFPIRVSDVEVHKPEALATFDLLCSLREEEKETTFAFLIGTDWLQPGTDLREWTSKEGKTGERLVNEFDFLVVKRPGYEVAEGLAHFGPRMSYLEMPHGMNYVSSSLSSTEIRKRAAVAYAVRASLEAQDIHAVDGLLPPAVVAYLARRSLYCPTTAKSEPKKRVAVYGGAFDPPTNGHLSCAAEIVHSGAADEVLLVPCGPRPDKPKLRTPAVDRYIMCQIAVSGSFSTTFPANVSDVDVGLPEAQATYDMLVTLRDTQPDTRFIFVIGSDWLQPGTDLREWTSKAGRTGDKLVEEFDFLVVRRPGYDVPDLSKFGPRMQWLELPPGMSYVDSNVSSTEIRKRAAVSWREAQLGGALGDIAGLVSPGVLAFIMRKELYKPE